MTKQTEADLIGHGRLSWWDTRALLAGCTCAWADLEGFHVGKPPTEPPIASHLWGWDPERLVRARIDGDDCVAAELRLHPAPAAHRVQVAKRSARTWPLQEGRVSVADRWRDLQITIYEVVGLMPLSFAQLDD